MNTFLNQKITPFLWFDKNAEEAISFYTSIFPNSAIVSLKKWPAGGYFPAGTVQSSTFTLDGVQFHAFDAGPKYKFNESISLFVTCKDQSEVDYYWEKLSAGGEEGPCGWLKDKFGISWQVIPEFLTEKISNGEPGRIGKMMQELNSMKKIEVAELKEAYNQ